MMMALYCSSKNELEIILGRIVISQRCPHDLIPSLICVFNPIIRIRLSEATFTGRGVEGFTATALHHSFAYDDLTCVTGNEKSISR